MGLGRAHSLLGLVGPNEFQGVNGLVSGLPFYLMSESLDLVPN